MASAFKQEFVCNVSVPVLLELGLVPIEALHTSGWWVDMLPGRLHLKYRSRSKNCCTCTPPAAPNPAFCSTGCGLRAIAVCCCELLGWSACAAAAACCTSSVCTFIDSISDTLTLVDWCQSGSCRLAWPVTKFLTFRKNSMHRLYTCCQRQQH